MPVVHLVLVAPALGQQSTAAAIRGSVTSSTGDSVPYALVRLIPGPAERFTDQRGRFSFAAIPRGAYRLHARQVGFEPSETFVALASDSLTVSIVLRPIAITLAELRVTARQRCRTPGPPDSTEDPQLATILIQLRENAERYAALANSYPFRYSMERLFRDYTSQRENVWSLTDTVEYQSSAAARYRPGYVVRWGRGPAGSSDRVLDLPTLSDFADTVFQATHCFGFAGTAERDGERLLRISFTVAESIRVSDIEGDVELDALTYQIRRATIRLTRTSRAIDGLVSAVSSIDFGELYPNIVIPRRVESSLEYAVAGLAQPGTIFRGAFYPAPWWRPTRPVAKSTEDQHLIQIQFQHPLPGSEQVAPGERRLRP